jgi:YebC/PmpR family DNA-binding regulatory protein
MSGHSKWSSIKHKKAARDAKRGKLFTKLIKEITVAARMGGSDLNANPRLRTAVTTARANSMPADNIERAIKKGTGELEGVDYLETTYEGYGPGGFAMLVEVLTDNKNRTVADLRNILGKNGGNLGESGCVAWMFDEQGQIRISSKGITEERVFEVAAEAGASDVSTDDDVFVVTTPVEALESVRQALLDVGAEVETAELVKEPKSVVALTGGDAARALRLIDALEDHDDVQRVSANFEIDDEELGRLSA